MIVVAFANAQCLDISSGKPIFDGKNYEYTEINDSAFIVFVEDTTNSLKVTKITTNLQKDKKDVINNNPDISFEIVRNDSIWLFDAVNNSADNKNRYRRIRKEERNKQVNNNDSIFTSFSFRKGREYTITHRIDNVIRKCTFKILTKRHKKETDISILNDTILIIGSYSLKFVQRDTLYIFLKDSTESKLYNTIADSIIIKDSIQNVLYSETKYKQSEDYADAYRDINDPNKKFKVGDILFIYNEKDDLICIVKFEIEPYSPLSILWICLFVILLIVIILFIIFRKCGKTFIKKIRETKVKQKNQISEVERETIKRQLASQLESIKKKVSSDILDVISIDDIDNIGEIRDSLEMIKVKHPSLFDECGVILSFISQHKYVWKNETIIESQENRESNKQVILEPAVTSESSLFDEISEAISSIYVAQKEYTKKEATDSICLETYEKLKGMIVTLSHNVEKQQKEKVAAAKKEIEDSKQKAVDDAVKVAKEELANKIVELEKKNNDAEQKAQDAEKSKQKAVDDAVKVAKEELANKIAELERKKNNAEQKAQDAEKSKQKAVDDAVKVAKEELANKIAELERKKNNAEQKAQDAEKSKQKAVDDAVKAAKKDNEKELKKLEDQKNEKIKRLEKALEDFTRSLSSVVPYTETYSKQVHALFELGCKIQSEAYSILEIGSDDPYFIMKALSKYGKAIDSINMERFLTDVNMASKANFMFNDSSLAEFKADNKNIDAIVRSYFFQYLDKYINAIMVLNESMAGLSLLTPEVKSKTTIFEKFRNDILALTKQLKINVLFVKVGDMAGENVDLKAKTVDVEIGKPGQILEIENCIVYLMDNRKPQTKIKVTIKK